MSFQKPLKLFIAYAHEDESFKDELTKRLEPLKQKNEIKVWHDGELVLGYKYPEAIDRHLKNADVVLYLVSADSLASIECNKEIASALDNQKRFVPIILRECDWKRHEVSGSSIADFPALPKDSKPIDSWEKKDEAWQNVIDGLRKILDSAEEQKDTHQSTLFELGNAKYMLGALDEALANYNKAIELEPDFAEAYASRGILFRKLEQYDKAEKDLTKLIELEPNLAAAYTSRGDLLLEIRQYDKAEKDLAKAIELKPDLAVAYVSYGNLLCKLEQYKKAEANYNKAIELKPDFAEAYASRGILFNQLEQYGEAEEDLTKAIELKPGLTEVYYSRGLALYNLEQYDNAEANYNKAIELKPDYTIAYVGRGVLFSKLEQYDKFIADVKKAKELYQQKNDREGVAFCKQLLND